MFKNAGLLKHVIHLNLNNKQLSANLNNMSLYIIQTFITIMPETVIIKSVYHNIATNFITYSIIRIFISETS